MALASKHWRAELTLLSTGRGPEVVKAEYGSELKPVELVNAFGRTEAEEHL